MWRYLGPKLGYMRPSWGIQGALGPHVEVPRAAGTQPDSRALSQVRSKIPSNCPYMY